MRTRLLLTTFFVLLTVGALAGTRTKEEMKEAAMRVLVRNSAARGMSKSTSSSELKEYLTKGKLSILGSEELGFAVVTNDDRFEEVIGYSTTSYTDTVPCGFRWWLEGVEQMMENESVQPASARASKVSVNGSVAPLMKTEWGQDNPFNAQLRYTINGNSYQFITGCVATAMAQVMKYHEYPEKSQGSIEYVVWNFKAKMSHTFGDTYDWKNMLDKYNYQIYGSLDAPAKAVSILMRDCGMAVEMNYGPKSIGSSASSSKIAPGLITYFSYDSKGTKLYKRSDYQKDTWMQMIYDELKAGRPIIYNGIDNRNPDEPTGHSFVIHGYDSTGKVYINWGGQGAYDGYFDIDMLNVDQHEYNDNQDMVFVKPGSGLTTTYTLSISSSGNGQVTYSSNAINNTTKSFTINEGTSPTLTFTPNTGYRVKSVKVNNVDVTSSISNNKYTISNISQNTMVNVTFEAIPVTTYTLSISSSGSGQVTYSSNTINNTTKSFTVNEGTSATLTFTPNTGSRVKSVKVNNVDVTSSISNNQYTISKINNNTTVDVIFEAVQTTTYTITIKATGNGSALYDNSAIKAKTSTFTVDKGTSVTISFVPDDGYGIKSVKVDGKETIPGINGITKLTTTLNNVISNKTVEVEFDAIYTLSVNSTGSGSVVYDGKDIRNGTTTFNVLKGTSATLTFTPDAGYKIKSIMVNETDVTSSITNNQYIATNLNSNTQINVVFEKEDNNVPTYTITVTSHDEFGHVSCCGKEIRNTIQTFAVDEGSDFTMDAVPDNGYRVAKIRKEQEGFLATTTSYADDSSESHKVTLSKIKGNYTIDVYFEKIPSEKPKYTVIVNSHDNNGYAESLGAKVRNGSHEFSVDEGSDFTINAIPDNGYRVAEIMREQEGYLATTTSYADDSSESHKVTLYKIKGNYTIDIYFEKIPSEKPKYTVIVNSHENNGYAESLGMKVRNGSHEFSVDEGSDFTINAIPDNGYRVAEIMREQEGYLATTTSYADDSSESHKVTLSKIKGNYTIDVYFEELSSNSHILSIQSLGNGTVQYLGTTINGTTKTFTVKNGDSALLTFTPNDGYRVGSVKVDNVDVTSSVSDNKYTINNINKNTSVEVVFEAESNNILVDNYPVQSAQFDLINGKVVFVSNWSEFSYYALTQKLDNMTKEYFDANYEPDLLATNIGTTSDGNPIDQLKIFKSFTLKGDANASNDLGIAPYYSNWQGSTNHRFTWVLTADELERLTNNQSSPVQITRYVRYKEKSKISPRPKYPYIYIKMTVNLTRKASYTLSIQSIGNGSVSYNGTDIRDSKKTFNVVEGNSVKISFAPDNGYRIKSVEVNSSDVTSSISDNQYSINNISKSTTVNVAFEPDTNTNNILSCSDLSCYTSSSPTLKVNLQNVDEVKLCQFDLRLPNGVKVAKKSNGKLNATLTARADGHSISSSQLSNGDYRFIISSMSNDSFTGNSGTLVEITLDVPATMASGEYTVKVMNVELSVPNGNDLRVVKPKDTDSKLTIVSYRPGDVNNDGSVSVTDVGCVINYILEQVPSTFIFGAADMNSDGEVSVTDVGIIINQILSGEASSRNCISQLKPLSGQMALLPTVDGYQLTLEDMDAFIGFQFDVEGADLDGIQLISGNDHLLNCRQLDNGKFRVVCYSLTNSAFIPRDNHVGLGSSLLRIASVGDVVISNIRLTTSNFDELLPSALCGMKTGIASVGEGLQISVKDRTLSIISDRDLTIRVYTLGGRVYRTLDVRRGENIFDGMRAGVYMIDNNKITIR